MGNEDDESEQKQPPAMKRPRPSEIRRHGFGSPEGMEMTDFPPPRPAIEPEATQGQSYPVQPSPTRGSSYSISPLEEASTTALIADASPPSVAALTSAAEVETPTVDELGTTPSLTPVQHEGEMPKPLRKRRLFFTPSRRKSKNTPPQETTASLNPNPNRLQQPMPMLNPGSPRIRQNRSTPPSLTTATTNTPRPRPTQLRTLGPSLSTRPSSGRVHGRRRQTGAPQPTGLSGYSTPRSGRRRPSPTYSGRRGFNPLERISGIFSPQSPNFSPASPITSDFVPDDADSSYSDSSVSGSVKEPFAEQVERLDQLLATPSQQLGALALTASDQGYRSDDYLDDEVEGLESSRRLLAEELSRIDFSLLDRGGFGTSDDEVARTPKNVGETKTVGETKKTTTTTSLSPSQDQKASGDKKKDIDWVPLLGVEAHHPPNFSPSGPLDQYSDVTASTGDSGVPFTAMLTPDSSRDVSVSKGGSTVNSGDEDVSPLDETRGASGISDEHQEEDKKPAAKVYPTSDRKKPPPISSPEKSEKSFGEKKDSPVYTPPRPLPRGSKEEVTIPTTEGENKTEDRNWTADFSTDDDERDQQGLQGDKTMPAVVEDSSQQHVAKTGDSDENSTVSGVVAEEKDSKPATPQSTPMQLTSADDQQQDFSERSRSEGYSPESMFNPFGLDLRDEAQSSSLDVVSATEEISTVSSASSSSTSRSKNIFKSFLSFSKRFSDDGRYLKAGSTPTRNVEHSRRVLEYLNTIFPPVDNESRNEGEQNPPPVAPNRGILSIDEPQTTEEDTPMNKEAEGDEKEMFFTPPRDQEPRDGNSFRLSPESQDFEEEESNSKNQDTIPLLGSTFESSTKPSKLNEPSIVIPILSDDSDDDILFHKDSQQSVVYYDIGAPAPGDNEIGFNDSEIPKRNDKKDKRGNLAVKVYPLKTKFKKGLLMLAGYPSKTKYKKGLLILAIIFCITGLGLVIGALLSNVEETPAPSASVTFSPSQEANLAPSFSPSEITPIPSLHPSLNPSGVPSENPSASPTLKESENPTTLPSISSIPTITFSPNGISSVPSLRPSANTLIPSSANPSGVPSENPSASPTRKESEIPTMLPSISSIPTITFSPNGMSSVPSLRPSANTLIPSSANPSGVPSENPSAFPTQKGSESPTSESPTKSFGIISFTVPFKIFIANGLVEFVPQSEYIPELKESMDLLNQDVLLNVAEKKKVTGGTRLTEIVLPTSIIGVVDIDCPDDIENSLCQEVIAEISLVNAKDSWQRFKDTAEFAIQIGRLQFYLERVDRNSPVEVIDALWTPPKQGLSVGTIINDPPSLSPTAFPTSSPLLDFLKESSSDGGEALNITSSPQFKAFSWLSDNNFLTEYSENQLLQRFSMATLYYATNGDQWLVNTFWLSDRPACAWFGKTGSKRRCNARGELMHLELDFDNLNGSLPPELGLLSPALESITINGGPNSNLLGTLPTELGYLSRLKVFIVRNNDLSGTIPSEIGNLQMLEEIDLSRNRFRGEVPTQIGLLSDLIIIEISVNNLSGSLPSELGQLSKCQIMFFEDNAFVSSVPTEIGDLKELKALKAGFNKFDSLPTELGSLDSTDFISFQDCNITGPIPTELGTLRRLRHLELGNNALTGSIPSELGQIQSLRTKLDLSHNQLSGRLPTELGLLVNLRGIQLNNNLLSGMVPSELSQLNRLTSVQLHSNDLSGTIPAAVCAKFNVTNPAFQTDCGDFDDNCPCCTTCCVDNTCTCRYLGTSREFLCFQRKNSF